MSRSRFKLLGFEQLEDRYLLSAAVSTAPRSSVLAAASLGAGQQASSPAGDGQFAGQRTISYIDGSLHAGQAQALSTLQVLQDQDFHFVLTAAQWQVPSQTGVRMLILDASGQPVFAMTDRLPGDTSAVEDYLEAGSYEVQFTRDAAEPGGLLRFDLGGVTLPLADTTQNPAETSSKSTQAALSFYWLPPTALPSGLVAQQPSAPLTSVSLHPDDAAFESLLRFMTGPDLQGGSEAEVPTIAALGGQATALPRCRIPRGRSQSGGLGRNLDA